MLPSMPDAVAGLELGGVPIATILSQITGLPTLFVRKAAKEYGTCKLAEGGEIKGKQLLIVEDVVTSGGAILQAVRELRDLGATVHDVVCVIDRESGGVENLAKEQLALNPLFTISEFNQAAGESTVCEWRPLRNSGTLWSSVSVRASRSKAPVDQQERFDRRSVVHPGRNSTLNGYRHPPCSLLTEI